MNASTDALRILCSSQRLQCYDVMIHLQDAFPGLVFVQARPLCYHRPQFQPHTLEEGRCSASR